MAKELFVKCKANEPERVYWIDTLRFLLIVRIFTTHFRASIKEGRYVYGFFMNLITANGYGVSGKFCVLMFAVILGYFATLAGYKEKERYIETRYIYFISCMLFINVIYYVLSTVGAIDKKISIINIVSNTFLLGDGIYATAWCILPYFIGSVICYLGGRCKISLPGWILVIVAFIGLGNICVASCIMGVSV